MWTEKYTPFGISMVNAASNDNQAGFTGHIKDSDTGLTYMQARYYDPVVSRFLSHDPEGFLSQDLNPMYFNRYKYAANNPINAKDPNGEAAWFVVVPIIWVADKAYGAYDGYKTAKAVANGEMTATEAATEQAISQSGAILAGPLGRLMGKAMSKSKKTGDGIVYRRTNPETGEVYIGQTKSPERFEKRKKEHDRDKETQHEFEIVEENIHPDDIDYVEDTLIREEGLENLENKRHQMSETRRAEYELNQD